MKIIIDIPKEFNIHWEMDRFKDSLRRMKADADSCEMWSGNYEAELCEMLITAFAEAQEIKTPHGDLIDMDSEIDVYDRYDDDIIRPSTVRDLINDFISGKYPRTIIKAEK